ncbi:zinc ribbon domain-containing protein [uncultured Sphingomonas sp.]|uniref:zinc ribbon domain-containing protein n=1 Tax=uncultured Sphingomonas sp. TaxID=158754 RepID=UPI0035CBE587
MAREKKCPRCAEMVKADALVCRYCGYEFRVADMKRVSERPGCLKLFGITFAVLVGLVVFTSILIGPKSSSINGASTADNTFSNDPAQVKEKADETRRGEIALAAGKALKQSVRNPDSLVIEQAFSNDNESLLCVEYRAQNGFGGMNREFVAFQDGATHQSSAFWNKHCRKGLHNQTYNVRTGTGLS